MIYNTFNISVMERVREYGLLRCVGAAKSQIKKLVKREGLTIALRAIPLGIALGMLMTFACSAVLKYANPNIFGVIPLFTLRLGIYNGCYVGFNGFHCGSAARTEAAECSRECGNRKQ